MQRLRCPKPHVARKRFFLFSLFKNEFSLAHHAWTVNRCLLAELCTPGRCVWNNNTERIFHRKLLVANRLTLSSPATVSRAVVARSVSVDLCQLVSTLQDIKVKPIVGVHTWNQTEITCEEGSEIGNNSRVVVGQVAYLMEGGSSVGSNSANSSLVISILGLSSREAIHCVIRIQNGRSIRITHA